jgi:hypothetical protein
VLQLESCWSHFQYTSNTNKPEGNSYVHTQDLFHRAAYAKHDVPLFVQWTDLYENSRSLTLKNQGTKQNLFSV